VTGGSAHGGNLRKLAQMAGVSPRDLVDFSASVNPLGPPEWLRAVVSASLSDVEHYPDPECRRLVEAICARYGVAPERVVVGNGSAEIIAALPRVLRVAGAVTPVPTYSDYATAAREAGLVVKTVALDGARDFALDVADVAALLEGDEVVFVGRPNNPTGALCPREDLVSLASEHPRSWFVVDEAFIGFVGDDAESDAGGLLGLEVPNLIVLRSLTKLYAIPGLRLGFAVAPPDTAAALRRAMAPWSVNTLAQAVGVAALADEQYVRATRDFVADERRRFAERLGALPGLHVFPGSANYLLIKMGEGGMDAVDLAGSLLRRGLAIRVCDDFEGLGRRYFRVAVRTSEEDDRLLQEIQVILEPGQATSERWPATADGPRTAMVGGGRRPTAASAGRRVVPAVMFQGTGSDVGKSVLAAAFCRILLEDGYRVAPFKAQNISLNSFVTANGGEMGRAQAVQALACRLDPDVRMNPVLLKPSGETGAQVVMWGKPVGTMAVHEYQDYTAEAREQTHRAYDSLAQEYDAMVLEGAGSCAEVNLRRGDIVNMSMAAYAGSPVALVGDIDRGGVFAAFVGTMELLTEHERRLVAGFIINKFRGDQSLLGAAIRHTDLHTGVPTWGVVPFLRQVGLPDEDSVAFKASGGDAGTSGGGHVRIALVDLPYASNLTDFDPLKIEPDVELRIVRSVEDLRSGYGDAGAPDAVILPGSKNTLADLAYLRSTGLAREIEGLSRSGSVEIVGVCAGFQMLGGTIADPLGVESADRAAEGLGLLAFDTTMAEEKTLRLVQARHLASGKEMRGYEIHHGRTVFRGAETPPAIHGPEGEELGAVDSRGIVWGTYVHGLFDADEFRRWFIDRLRERRGIEPLGRVVARYDIEPAIEDLARVVRVCLDVPAVYRAMGLV
jgi:adenosylcobyric acid synthase